jgi:hypothetical protein
VIYPTVTDLEKIIEMGFEQGITVYQDQLESLPRAELHKSVSLTQVDLSD